MNGALAVPAEPGVPRADLMAAAFAPAIVAAGVFDAHELPHGATGLGRDVYFVVYAPHAVQMALVTLTPAGRVLHPMQPTPDNRYWWCARPAVEFPHGQRYRFLQNDDVEVLDPASRWVADPASELWANVGEGADRAWSLYLDRATLAAIIGPAAPALPWDDLVVYELHAQRFTVRNAGVADGLDQVAAELAPGGYLARLGVSALEFLPLHEFSKGSWGYNPSLFFAVESTFGGPEALARLVRAARAAGKGIFMDVVFNHLQESPLQALARDVYVDGDTAWGDEVNYDHPACMEFLRQALVYLWQTFQVDGFRFDSTQAIINGQWPAPGIIRVGGSGGGWELLGYLRAAVRKAADATGRGWPYFVGENDPNDWAITNDANGGVLDGQWHFGMHYPLDDATWENGNDDTSQVVSQLSIPHLWLRPFSEAVRYAESHDSCGHREDWRLRVARRAPFGRGFQTAKAVGTLALLAHGIPMLFMGQEGGEDEDFYFDYDPATNRGDQKFFARLALYDDLGDQRNHVLAWYRDLIGLRRNRSNGLLGNDDQTVGYGYRTVAISRAQGRFFVVATFGTSDTRQDLGWLRLPGGASYKEIFNSSWPAYGVEGERDFGNGGYDAVLTSTSVVNLPPVGGVVLERR